MDLIELLELYLAGTLLSLFGLSIVALAGWLSWRFR